MPATRVVLDTRSVWRAAWVVVVVAALAAFGLFVLRDGAPVFFPVIMAFFASIAMEPLVRWLARWMPRGAAAALVLIGGMVSLALFFALFGGLLRDQVVQIVQSAPGIVDSLVSWVNQKFGTDLDTQALLSQIDLGPEKAAQLATQLAGGVLGVLTSVLSAAFSAFTFLFFTFYLSADATRLRTWAASMVQPRHQVVVLTLWEIALTKIGGYVAARLVLASICAAFTGAFLLVIGMPYWLPLGLWTGVVAQFVPTIGTYIAIVLPVVVGLVGPDPRQGLYVLAFALVYQQIENLTFEPRISAKAVQVHPGVSFAAAILGGALFGASGALVGVPVSATLIALFDIYKQRYAISASAESQAVAAASHPNGPDDGPDPG